MRRLEADLAAELPALEVGGRARPRPAPTETAVSVEGRPAPLVAGGAMASWSGADKPEKAQGRRRRSWGPSAREAAAEARERLEAGRWGDAEPRHLVGLYAVLHESVYGVAPEELAGDAFPGATSAARKLAAELGGAEAVVEFLRWTWSRERGREKKREPGEGFRIGWRLMFCARTLVTDWKIDLVRAGRVARPTSQAGGSK